MRLFFFICPQIWRNQKFIQLLSLARQFATTADHQTVMCVIVADESNEDSELRISDPNGLLCYGVRVRMAYINAKMQKWIALGVVLSPSELEPLFESSWLKVSRI